MILKGNQRGGGADLATHLLNEFDNERVQLAEIRGTVADDLHGAFGEYEAIAAGTRCKEPLYSLSINPSAPISREQYFAAIDRIEERLGLSGHPRAVVFHVKNGREHCHVVWSRIDITKMRAVQMSHDRMKLRGLSRELAHELGLPLPEGLATDRGAERQRKKDMTLAEKAQAEETGVTPRQRREEITAAFRRSDSAEAFRAALKEKGYVLAKGDRRGFVVVDRHGNAHSLARQIDGARTREVNAKLAGLAMDQLPAVEEAREAIRRRQADAEARVESRVDRRMSDLAAKLTANQSERRRKLGGRRQDLSIQHSSERLALDAAHKSEADKPFARASAAIFALFDRLPGLRSVIAPLRRNPRLNPLERQRIEKEALERRHQRERMMLERRGKALDRLEARERRSLEAVIRRKVRAMETVSDQKAAQRYNEIEVNKLDITLPGSKLEELGKKRDGKEGWKARQEKLGASQENRSRGYRRARDDP